MIISKKILALIILSSSVSSYTMDNPRTITISSEEQSKAIYSFIVFTLKVLRLNREMRANRKAKDLRGELSLHEASSGHYRLVRQNGLFTVVQQAKL